ncbi:MAG: hypothetical protein IT584_01260 [Chlamydiae bacterium]|nr:hypothetical protein [Chlamydiota bacterium]
MLAASIRPVTEIKEFDSSRKLRDEKFIGIAIMQCLVANDPEGVLKILEGHIGSMSKSLKAPTATMHELFKSKNPSIKTLAKIVHEAHQNLREPS